MAQANVAVMWRKAVAGGPRPVVAALTPGIETLLVSTSEWHSYLQALQTGAEPRRVILVIDGEDRPAADAVAFVDAVVADDPEAIESALRLTQSEMAEAVGSLSDEDLAHTARATSADDVQRHTGIRLDARDVARVAAAARGEREARGVIDALVAPSVVSTHVSSEPEHAAAAAVLLVALLRAGMRASRRGGLRGSTDGDNATPDVGEVRGLLQDGFELTGFVGDVGVVFALDADALSIESREVLDVQVVTAGGDGWNERGRRLRLPLGLFARSGAQVWLRPVPSPSEPTDV